MKRCPTCNKTFTDRNLSFCIDDGTPLVPVDTSEDEVTRVSPSSGAGGGRSAREEKTILAYQPPRPYVPPGTPAPETKRRAWPWIVGLLALVVLLLVGFGIAGAILIPRMIRSSSNQNTSNSNARMNRGDNLNSNRDDSRATTDDENTNDNEDPDVAKESAPPTDQERVLSELTELEHEWTVANINADKKKLERILADDYVGTSADGHSQGKAEYLETIKRDTTIQRWEFEDLKVDLNGDRASLTGIIRLQLQDEPVAYRFTDKFVWRDGRWQATGSEVTPVK